MLTTVLPARLAGVCDTLMFDRWQDGEGLTDASDACGAAWKDFGDRWRKVRELDHRKPLGHDGDWRDDLADDQLVAIGALLRCRGSRGSISKRERKRFKAWLVRAGSHRQVPLVRLWQVMEGSRPTRQEASILCLVTEMWQSGIG